MTTIAGGVSLKHRTNRPRSNLRSNPSDRRTSRAPTDSPTAQLLLEEAKLGQQQRLERSEIVNRMITIANKSNLSPRQRRRQLDRLRRRRDTEVLPRHREAWRAIDDRWLALEAVAGTLG